MADNAHRLFVHTNLRHKKLPSSLTPQETQELARREEQIKIRAAGRVGDGRDLLAIRDGNLWRASNATFEDYLLARSNIHRTTGYRIMAAGAVIEELLSQLGADENLLRTVLEKHADEASLSLLRKMVPPSKRLMIYRTAFILAGKTAPLSHHILAAHSGSSLTPQIDNSSGKSRRKHVDAAFALYAKLAAGGTQTAKETKRVARELHACLWKLGYRQKRSKESPPNGPAASP